MFVPWPDREELGVAPQHVLAVFESINTPTVAVPGHAAQPMRAYVIGVQTPSGGGSVVLYLWLLEPGLPVMFLSNPTEVAPAQYANLESAAVSTVENMGFLLDNLQFRERAPHNLSTLVERLPFFRAPSRAPAVPAVNDHTLALARLLSSF
jgi:hypothetical protein